MKRKLLIILSVCGIVLVITLVLWIRENNSSPVMNEIDLSTVNDIIIGSEFPKLLYADENKAIFDCTGIYVYNFKSKKISHSLDTNSFGETYFANEKYSDIRLGQFVSQDGDEIIMRYNDYNNLKRKDLPIRYSYSLSDKVLKEINKEEYEDKRKNVFECIYLEYEDDLYSKSTGMIVSIDENEYVYLSLSEFKVGSIKIVYVNGTTETVYDVFD